MNRFNSFSRLLILFSLILFCCSITHSYTYIVIDPGHTPQNPGALTNKKNEFYYNQLLVNELIDRLIIEQIPFVISNAHDQELQLNDRVRLTSKNSIFLSIHHDSVQPKYCNLSKIPCRTNYEQAKGFSIFISKKNPFYNKSLSLAKKLAYSLKAKGLGSSKHHGEKIDHENRELLDPKGVYRYDDLVVLKKAKSPALLLEVGVITNPNDLKNIEKESFRKKIIDAIIDMLRGAINLKD